jgi:hypothetical protein
VLQTKASDKRWVRMFIFTLCSDRFWGPLLLLHCAQTDSEVLISSCTSLRTSLRSSSLPALCSDSFWGPLLLLHCAQTVSEVLSFSCTMLRPSLRSSTSPALCSDRLWGPLLLLHCAQIDSEVLCFSCTMLKPFLRSPAIHCRPGKLTRIYHRHLCRRYCSNCHGQRSSHCFAETTNRRTCNSKLV